MAATISLVISFGAGFPGISACRNLEIYGYYCPEAHRRNDNVNVLALL